MADTESGGESGVSPLPSLPSLEGFELRSTVFGHYLIDYRDPENVTHVAILGEDWEEGEPE